ncbi:MAG: RDD family protein [Novosphingobium sp.]|nr:RDD family protein [Novosphingobium sp.]
MAAYGGFWRRVAAYIIDSIILNIAITMISGVLGLGIGFTGGMGEGLDEAAALGMVSTSVGVSLIGTWLYFAIMESSAMQATVGKLALGVIVTDLDGGRISFGRATGRYFAKILSGMILLIGFIMVGLTERKQGLHDMIAGTLCYKTRDPGSVKSSASVFE